MNQSREWLPAADAAAFLDVKRATLYAYASRGLVRSAPGASHDRSRFYHREDLERLKARSRARAGHGPVAAGALRWGEPVLETRIGTIGDEGPIYRGVPALELVEKRTSFEEACALLWQFPFTRPHTDTFGLSVGSLRTLLPRASEPFAAMFIAATALAALEPQGDGPTMMKARAGDLVRRLVASLALPSSVELATAALRAETTAKSLLTALGAGPRVRRSESMIEAINDALVLCADHELNASTFAARVAASSGANLGAAIVAGLAALSGPLHGAATARVHALVSEIAAPEHAAPVVAARLARGEPVPGFGHPLYPAGDPRGVHLLTAAERLSGSRGSRVVRILVALTNAMQRQAREAPTLDVGLVALAGALGLVPGAPLAIFASGRLAGYVAHALEQREEGHLLRPRARYTGASPARP